MKVELSDSELAQVEADLACIGLFDGEELPEELAEAPGAADVRGSYRKLTVLRPGSPERLLVVGLGPRDEFDAERARVAAALTAHQGRRYEASSIAWAVPGDEAPIAAALTEGTILAGYEFTRYRTPEADEDPPVALERLVLVGGALADDASTEVEAAAIGARAANRARELQTLPANVATPEFLAERAAELAAEHGSLSFEAMGPMEIAEAGMGGIAGVAQGSTREPRLIVLRYSGRGSGAPLGIVGKAVTFDTGGISIKPSGSMHEMKMDMSGGAAALEGTAAIAELGLPIDILTVIPAVENMPDGSAMRPGDVLTHYNGKTTEVLNTDAEGRLILADALAWCVEQGADRVIDLATLTGAVLVALGSTYAALVSNDDELADAVHAAGEVTGELNWRLPLHPEYKELTKGTITDLANASSKRKAGTIYAASFLEEFVGDAAWAHLDIAGTSWDTGRAYVGKGATGFGVRTLLSLARSLD